MMQVIPLHKLSLIILIPFLLTACGEAPEPESGVQPTVNVAPTPPDLPPPEGLLAEGAEWETLAEGYVFSEGPAAAADGTVYYAEPIFGHLYKVTPDGTVTKIDEQTQHTMGLVMGADGYIYACRNHAGQIVRYSPAGTYEVLFEGQITPLINNPNAPGEFCNDLAVNADGGIWFTDRINRQVIYLAPDGTARTVAEGWRGNGIVLSADRSMIVVTDSNEARLHAFAVGENGALTERPNYFDPIRLVEVIGKGEDVATGRPGTDGMTVDSDGRLYVASFYGIQVFGPDGKYIGVIKEPTGFVSNLTFGGPDYSYLYATGRKGIFRLKMRVQGVGW